MVFFLFFETTNCLLYFTVKVIIFELHLNKLINMLQREQGAAMRR